MLLKGPYSAADETYMFHCRVFLSDGKFLNEKTEVVTLEEGDVLRFFHSGQWQNIEWFALFKKAR